MAEVPFRPVRQLSEYKGKGPLLAGKKDKCAHEKIGRIKKYRADFYSRTPLSKYDHLQFEACYNLALEKNQCITMPTFLSAASMGCPEVSVAGC